MAKKATAKAAAPQKGMIDDLLKSLLKNFKPDLTKLDRAMFREGVGKALGAWKQTIPGPLDDMLIDTLAGMIADAVDNLTKTAAPDNGGGGGVILGMPKKGLAGFEVEMVDADKQTAQAYLDDLATSVPDANRKKLLAHPEVIPTLRRLSRENQIKVLQSSNLLDLLIKYGPLILKIVMMLLSFV